MAKKPNPESEYLKSDDIGLIIAKGMAVTYKAQPENPVDFFARWLLNQSQQAKNQILQEEKIVKVKESREAHAKQLKVKDKEAKELDKKQEARNDKIRGFRDKVDESKDLEDELQTLVNHLKDFTGSTAVYIGKVVKPKKAITDEDDDKAHVDEAAQPQVQFMNASGEHEFMVDKILKQDEGITYDLFKDDGEGDAKPDGDGENEEEGEEGEKKEQVVVEKFPKHLIVDECVREPRMHYYDVPKLGAYLAIKLEYESCLFEDAFDDAVVDFIAKDKARADQLKEKIEWEEQQAELRKDAEDDGKEYIPEEKEWPDIAENPYKTQKVQYVVCCNTMGQDRVYTEKEKVFALRAVQEFRDRWEALEKENLKSDVAAKVERAEVDKVYKESHEPQDVQELEKKVEEAVASSAPGEGDEPLTDEDKHMIGLKARFAQTTRTFFAPDLAAQHRAKMDRMAKDQLRSGAGERAQSAMGSHASARDDKSVVGGQYYPLVPEQWKDKIRDFRNLSVVKYARIWQAVFYLLKYRERQYVCERDTNCLHWKKAKSYLNDDFFNKLGDYWPIGPKEDSYKEYERMKFIQRNLEGVSEEELEDYSVALSKLYKWLRLAIEVRIEDVKMRRNGKEREKEKRQKAIEQENARKEKRQQQHDEAKAKFDEDQAAAKAGGEGEGDGGEAAEGEGEEKPEEDPFVPEFDSEAFYQTFDEENWPVDIPDEVEEDVDNDFNIPIPEEPVEEG